LRSALSQDKLSQQQKQQIESQIVAVRHPETIQDAVSRSQFEALKGVLEAGERLGDPHTLAINEQIGAIASSFYKQNPQLREKAQQNSAINYLNSLNAIKQALTSKGSASAQLATRAIEKIMSAIGDQTAVLNNIKTNGLKLISSNALKIKNLDKLEGQEKEEFSALNDEIQQGVSDQDSRFSSFQKSTEDVIEQSKDLDQIGANSLDDLRTLLGSDEDFAQVKKMWEEYYSSAPVPVDEATKTRADWIAKEKAAMQKALEGLLSENAADRENALKGIGKILPFVLMGKYKNSEVAKYLLAKFDAADTVYKGITEKKEENEDDLVAVKRTQSDSQKKTMALDDTNQNNITL
jgi:hypothetical protein